MDDHDHDSMDTRLQRLNIGTTRTSTQQARHPNHLVQQSQTGWFDQLAYGRRHRPLIKSSSNSQGNTVHSEEDPTDVQPWHHQLLGEGYATNLLPENQLPKSSGNRYSSFASDENSDEVLINHS